MHLIQV